MVIFMTGEKLASLQQVIHASVDKNSAELIDLAAYMHANPELGFQEFKACAALCDAMEKHGFEVLSTEWWHFTLKNEPYPNTYFDFPVRSLN